MKVDEALALVEAVLEDDRLNDVQELIFRQCWEGNQSYQEIAQGSGYDSEYLKATGAKLWKLLSEVFGEKVKKGNLQSVLKRYLRRNQITFHRNQVIGVNFSGASLCGSSLSGANLSVAKLYGTISEAQDSQSDFYKAKRPDDKIVLNKDESNAEAGINPIATSNSESSSHFWNGWQFRSLAEVKIAEALDRAGVLFYSNATARLTTPDGGKNQDPHFLVCSDGKLGILVVDGEEDEAETDRLVQTQGIRIIHHYPVTQCTEDSDWVVLEFLQALSQA
ncbi:pentapeptide repeat-containing protein [Laspinema olomoucense]|uniref:pentapeptide repeat-containing protein n=1 Tax=Laspinema olomoucense TaxID=3231600 RepID=UPI0021BA7F49|nr:pentapeptide repeat-containing protein [Laspinema sp. D3d]MCT7976015.1 pentapeptide repeat-containing protein [Laspinema sp. D3d]